MSSGSAMENTERRGESMINSDVKELMTLRKSIEDSNKIMENWGNQTSKLLESNKNIEVNYDKLMMKISDIDELMSETMKTRTVKKQELEDLQYARTNLSRKQWDDSSSEVGKYANNFCEWIMEYSSNVLMKDIENYHEECKNTSDGLKILKKELDDMTKKHDWDYVETNTNIDNLSNLNVAIVSSDNNLTHNVRLTKESLNKIQNKMEQCKVILNEYNVKENTNMF